MNKQEFLMRLSKGLSGLPKDDVEERLSFYSEMIDDRIEEGLSEDAAVSEIGDVDKIISQIIRETPITKLAKEKFKPSRALRAWEIVLLILGSPIWLSLLAAVLCVVLAGYIVLWSLIVTLWSVEVAFVFSAFYFAVCGIAFSSNAILAFSVGLGLLLAGLSVFLFFGCTAATKGVLKFTKNIALGTKKCFIRKEKNNV